MKFPHFPHFRFCSQLDDGVILYKFFSPSSPCKGLEFFFSPIIIAVHSNLLIKNKIICDSQLQKENRWKKIYIFGERNETLAAERAQKNWFYVIYDSNKLWIPSFEHLTIFNDFLFEKFSLHFFYNRSRSEFSVLFCSHSFYFSLSRSPR